MKFVTYLTESGENRVGLCLGSEVNTHSVQVIDFEKAYQALKASQKTLPELPIAAQKNLLAAAAHQESFLEVSKQIEKAAQSSAPWDPSIVKPIDQLSLNAPIPRPTSIRDGYAFRIHVETMRKSRNLPMIEEFDLHPTFYFSNHTVVTGPGPVSYPKRLAEKGLDYELELAIVIGKPGRNIPVEKAEDHIFGFMIFNDWSDRAIWLKHESKMSLGPAKAKDFASSFGPYLVTPETLEPYRVSSPEGSRWNLKMSASLNGNILSEGNANTMHWTFAQLISYASEGVELLPGEIIGSGTVGTGCLAELNLTKKTDGLWLKDQDEVICEIDQLGRLKNTVVMEKDSHQ